MVCPFSSAAAACSKSIPSGIFIKREAGRLSASAYEPSETFERLSPAVVSVVRSARAHGLEDREIVERVLDGTIVPRLVELLERPDWQCSLPLRIAVVKSGPAFEEASS